MAFTKFTQPIQTKSHQFFYTTQTNFSRPVHKFIYQMNFGILKSGNVQLNAIGRSLQESIPLKKTTERLSIHLDKPDLWHDISEATLKAQAPVLRKCRFMIYDLSDICKDYAEKMEGLETIYDDSAKELGQGYWLSNIT